MSLPFGSLQSSLLAIQNLISVHKMSNSLYAIPEYNAASSCGSLQFSSNDLSIVSTLIPPNSGSKKEKKTEQYAFLIKKEKVLASGVGVIFG